MSQPQTQNSSNFKNYPTDQSCFLSPPGKTVLQGQIAELQLMTQQQIIQKIKAKKQDILAQAQEVTQNCHQYFIDFTTLLIDRENQIKNAIDEETLTLLEEMEQKIQQISENEHSYNAYSQAYQVFKLLSKNFTQIQESLPQLTKIVEKCYLTTLEGVSEHFTEAKMSTNKIYINESEFVTTHKKQHGNGLLIGEQEFQRALERYQQREQNQLLTIQRLKNKLRSLQGQLTKRGILPKELPTAKSTLKYGKDFWDLELERVKGENKILTEQINNISNKLLELVSEKQAVKSHYEKLLGSQGSLSNLPSNFLMQIPQDALSFQENSRSFLTQEFQTEKIKEKNQFQQLARSKPNKETENNHSTKKVGNKCSQGVPQQCNPSLTLSQQVHSNEKNLQGRDNLSKENNLAIILTNKMKELEEAKERQDEMRKEKESLSVKLLKTEEELEKIRRHCQTLQHDYEIASKKKFQAQQKAEKLKNSLDQLQARYENLRIETQLEKQNVLSMLKIKEESLSEMQAKIIKDLEQEHQAKIKQASLLRENAESEVSLCRKLLQEAVQEKALQIQNMRSEIEKHQRNVSHWQQKHLVTCQEKQSLQFQLDQIGQNIKAQEIWKQKYEDCRKDISKAKKQSKQLRQANEELKASNQRLSQILNFKNIEIATRVGVLFEQFEKLKTIYEAREKITEFKQQFFRERFEQQMAQMMVELKSAGKQNPQLIQKYIENLAAASQKQAETRRLKEQLKQLKSSKSKPSKNLIKSNFPCQTDIGSVVKMSRETFEQITTLQKTLVQDRYLVQKKILSEKNQLLDEELQVLKNQKQKVEQKTQNLQKQLELLKEKYDKKQLQPVEKKELKELTQLRQKLQRTQNQLKAQKNINKKNQEDYNLCQNELRKKKEHINNLKKELVSKDTQLKDIENLLKAKEQQAEKNRVKIKQLSLKQALWQQAKEKLERLTELDKQNQQLKKQQEKQTATYRFEVSKLQNELKELKQVEKTQMREKVTEKTLKLNEELNETKTKYKKLKAELDRKQDYLQHIKNKYEATLEQVQSQNSKLHQKVQLLEKQLQQSQKQLQGAELQSKKHRNRAKLMGVLVKKIYQKLLKQAQSTLQKCQFSSCGTQMRQQSVFNLEATSPIIKKHFLGSNILTVGEGNSIQKESHTQADIQFQDISKYSEGLQMFNISPEELQRLQAFNQPQGEISMFNQLLRSPQKESYTSGDQATKRIVQGGTKMSYETVDSMQKSSKRLGELLGEKCQLQMQKVLEIFEFVIRFFR